MSWNQLRRLDNKDELTTDDPDILNKVFGTQDPIKEELVIHAELIQLLSNNLESRIGSLPPNLVIRITLNKLWNLEKGQTKENVKTLLDKLIAMS